MKMKNEEEKNEDFFYLAKIFQFIFFWNFELRWFQICIQIFHIFLLSKVTVLWSGPILPVFDHFKPTLEGCSVWSKKNIKNLNTYLKSAKFKVSEKYQLKYFSQLEKIFIFLHFHFRVFWKFWKSYILPLRIIFLTRYYF